MLVKKYNIFLLSFSILWILYSLNQFAIVSNIKVFMFFIPSVLLVYLYQNIKLTIESKILLTFLLFIFFNQFLNIFDSNSNITTVLSNNARLVSVFLLIIPFYHLYSKNYKLFDNFFIISILIVIVSNFYYYFSIYDHYERFRGTFGNPNEFALFLTFLIYFILYYFNIYDINFKKKFFLMILLIAASLLILISLSRSGIIIMLMLYFFYYISIRKSMGFLSKLFLFFILVLVVLYLYQIFSQEFLLLMERFSNSEGSISTKTRLEQILAASNALNDNFLHILFGNGTGITSDANWFGRYYEINSLNEVMRIHNSFMSLLVEDGIVGLGLYILFHTIIFVKIINLNNSLKYLLLGYFLGAILYSQMAYIVYFFPYWLSMVILSLHAERLKKY